MLIIWDGARPHRATIVRQHLDSLEGHIQIAFLTLYCPELNPVQHLWAWLKRHAIANFCPDNLNELHTIPATSSKATSAGLRSSPRAGFRQRCGDVMIYGTISKYPSRSPGSSDTDYIPSLLQLSGKNGLVPVTRKST